MSRALHYSGLLDRMEQRKLLLEEIHRKLNKLFSVCLKICKGHSEYMYTNEIKVKSELSLILFRRQGTLSITGILTLEHSGGSVLLRGLFTSAETGRLVGRRWK